MNVRITRPDDWQVTAGFTELYATGDRVDTLRSLKIEKRGDLYATLLFSEDAVTKTHAEFLGRSYYPGDYEPDDGTVYVPAEGKVMMLFTKPV